MPTRPPATAQPPIADPVTSVELAHRYGVTQRVVAGKFRCGVFFSGVYDGRRWVADWSDILELERPGRGRLTGEARARAKRRLLSARELAERLGKRGKNPGELVRKEVARGQLAGLELRMPGSHDLYFDEEAVESYWSRCAARTRERLERQAAGRPGRGGCPQSHPVVSDSNP